MANCWWLVVSEQRENTFEIWIEKSQLWRGIFPIQECFIFPGYGQLQYCIASYKNLEIWKLADQLVVEIHDMTLTKLPKFEMFQEGAQIRRSGKSVKSTIVEGCGRKPYEAEFIKCLAYSLSSNDETIDHLETLFSTKSLRDEIVYNYLHAKLETLGKKINLFIKGVDNTDLGSNQSPATSSQQPVTTNQHQTTSNENGKRNHIKTGRLFSMVQ